MAVIVKYIVVRNGVEKMTFTTKKDADAHDKMLDIADNLYDFLEKEKIKLNESQLEEVSLLLAKKRDFIGQILRGIEPKKPQTKSKKILSAPIETAKTDNPKPADADKSTKKK